MQIPDPVDILLEDYRFLRYCDNDLEGATKLLGLLAQQADDALRFPLIEAAIVVYRRPFSGNRGSKLPGPVKGVVRTKVGGDWFRRHSLSATQHVPKGFTPLHQKLGELRNQAFAHSSVVAHPAEIMPLTFAGSLRYALPLRPPDYAELLTSTDEFESLIRAVIDSLTAEIRRIESSPEFVKAVSLRRSEKLSLGTIDLAGRGPDSVVVSPIIIDLGRHP